MPRKAIPIELRFWDCVKKTRGCWLWTMRPRTGYGRAFYNGKTIPAHRASWELHHGPIPVGMKVLHACDNRLCVRPSHLFLGTSRDNTHDMMKKGRASWQLDPTLPLRAGLLAKRRVGEESPKAVLSAEEVFRIRRARHFGSRAEDLAIKYGTAISNIYAIWTRRSWKHLSE